MVQGQQICTGCGGAVGARDIFCRACGRRLSVKLPIEIRSKWAMLLAVATVGPFAIPLVWRTPGFSKSEKYAWTAFIAALTAAVCAVFYYLMVWAGQIFAQAARMMSEM